MQTTTTQTHEPDAVGRLMGWGSAQPTVRALILTGSRANPHAQIDRLSDFDLEVFVTDMDPFIRDEAWVRWFGEPLALFPDSGDDGGTPSITRLVLYEDGTRIDYNVHHVSDLAATLAEPQLPRGLDAGYRVLLDKDGLAGQLAPPTHTAYVRRGPEAAEFRTLVEEFWWGMTYVAKYLWRDDLLPARYSLHGGLDRLRQVLEWQIEAERGWSLPLGTRGRGFKWLLGAQRWRELERSLSGPSVEEHWAALFTLSGLFGRTAAAVAEHLEYEYPLDLDRRVTAYVAHVRRLEA